MIRSALNRVIQRVPFSVRKHYVLPFLYWLHNPELYRRCYNDQVFWNSFYRVSDPGEDRETIGSDFPALDAVFHYNAVENGIITLLRGRRFNPERVLDVGSGAGHWIDFYTRLFPIKAIVGVDISEDAIARLRVRFRDRQEVSLVRGHVADLDPRGSRQFDLVSCIGDLFHIVDDQGWRQTLSRLSESLRPGGILIASDLFGPLTVNVQFAPEEFSSADEFRGAADRTCNKRVRSRRVWRRELRRLGFRDVVFQKTAKARYVNTPENNLLLAVR